MRYFLAVLFLWITTSICAQTLQLKIDSVHSNDNLNVFSPLSNLNVFGGISGIEYVPDNNRWYLISDGTSGNRQSYIFELKGAAVDSFPSWNNLVNVESKLINKIAQAEAIRYNSLAKQFWTCTEGSLAGSITQIKKNEEDWRIENSPLSYRIPSENDNRGYESLALAGQDSIWTISEWPLPGDDHYARLLCLRCIESRCDTLAAYSYELDIDSCMPPNSRADGWVGNGISEILWIRNGRFLVLERCFDGKKGSVKLYETWITSQTTDLYKSKINKLVEKTLFRPLPKQEVVNFNNILNFEPNNLEGMTWGPGRKTIVVVSDNNFSQDPASPNQLVKTQFVVLNVVGGF